MDAIYISWRNAELAFSRNFRSEIAAASLDVKDLITETKNASILHLHLGLFLIECVVLSESRLGTLGRTYFGLPWGLESVQLHIYATAADVSPVLLN